MAIASASAAIAADNTFTGAVRLDGPFNLSVSGSFVADIALQRSFDGGASWNTVESYDAPTEKIGDSPEPGILWRLGCPSGGYTSGTAICRLSR